jgi:hypothetical protein
MENGTAGQGEGRDPSGFLSELHGNAVTVKLNSGVVYKGMLSLRLCGEIYPVADESFRRASICRWIHEHRARED